MLQFSLRYLAILFCFLSATSYAADYYWVGGSGTWSDINHWATSSGGSVKHVVVPSINDDVYIDGNSFTGAGQTLTINSLNAVCKSIDFTGVGFNPTLAGNELRIAGSMTLSPNLQLGLNGDFRFIATQTGQSLDFAGLSFPNNLRFEGVGGGWVISANLNLPGGSIYYTSGDLDLSNIQVDALSFQSSGNQVGNLNITNSQIYLYDATNSWVFNGANASITSSNSEIHLLAAGAVFIGNNHVYHKVDASSAIGTANFGLNNTSFNTLEVKSNANFAGDWQVDHLIFTPGRDYTFESGKTASILQSWLASGTCQANTRIFGAGGLAQLAPQIPLNFNYLTVKDLENLGPSTITLNQSLDLGGNVNLNIIPQSSRDLYWVGGMGDWSDSLHWSLSSGGPGGECVPGPLDNVFFDGNSFSGLGQTVTIDPLDHAYCHDMTWSSGQSPSFQSPNGKNLFVYGSLTLENGMVFSANNVVFEADDLGNTITTNTTQVDAHFDFDGTGAWELMDDLNMPGKIILHRTGSIKTNGNDITAALYDSDQANLRALDLGSSTITLGSANASTGMATLWDMHSQGMTLNAGTSQIILLTPNSRFRTIGGVNPSYHNLLFDFTFETGEIIGTASFNEVEFKAHGNQLSNMSIGTLIYAAGYQYFLEPLITVEILNNLQAQGNCEEQISIMTYPTGSAGFLKNGGSQNITYCTLENITASGTSSFTASSSINLGGNTGWTFIPRSSLDFYWIGGTGRWEDGANWSFSSGGAPANCIPGPIDDVFFDGNSFSAPGQGVVVDTNKAYCRNMDWTGASGNPTYTGEEELFIYGSLTLNQNMTWNPQKTTWFVGNGLGHTITMAGNTFPFMVRFERIGGQWILQDDFIVQGMIDFVAGGFETQSNYIRANQFSSPYSHPRDWNFGASKIEILAGGAAWNVARNGGLNLNAGTSTIEMKAKDAKFRTYGIGPRTQYHNLEFTNTAGQAQVYNNGMDFNRITFLAGGKIYDSNTIDSLIFSAGHEYIFEAGATQTIQSYWRAVGDCINYIDIKSMTAGSLATVSSSSALIDMTRVNLKDIEAQGGASFQANASIDLGNNPGWTINGSGGNGLYWIGDAGDWSDPNHWALFSGGPPSGCIPTKYDDVYFDQNSFSLPNQRVNVDILGECHNMDWTGAGFQPEFFSNNNQVDVYGSLILNPVMDLNLGGDMAFKTDEPNHTIRSFGWAIAFPNNLYFNLQPGGDITLLDSLTVTGGIFHTSGNWSTGQQVIQSGSFSSPGSTARSLDMTKTIWWIENVGGSWNVDDQGLTLVSTNSLIHMNANQALFQSSGSLTYDNLVFHGLSGFSEIQTNQTDFGYVLFLGDGKLNGTNGFDTLQFSAGYTYLLEEQDTQYVRNEFFARGNNCFPIVVHSQSIPNPAFISKPGGLVDSDFLELNSIYALGGANFYAGIFSVDAGNNTGWNFSNSGNYEYGLGPDTTVLLCSSLDTFHIVTLNFNGGIGWLWQDGYTGPNYPAVHSGLYSVTVTFANNCTTTDSVFVMVDTFVANPNPVQYICKGDSVDLFTNNMRGGFGYQWSTGETDSLIRVSPQADQTYWVDVSFGNYTCRDTLRVEVQDPSLSITTYQPLCFEDSTGVVSANLIDNLGPVQYVWSTGDTAVSISGLPAGTYTVEATDSLGCTRIDSVSLTYPSPLDLSFSIDSIDCPGEVGSLNLSPVGGTPGYTFVFSGFSPTSISPGAYSFQLIDSNGCTLDTNFTLLPADTLAVFDTLLNTNCPYDSAGFISISAIGENQPYTYLWYDGDTNGTKSNLPVGLHQVVITNSKGCEETRTYFIESKSDIESDGFVSPDIGIRPLDVHFEEYSVDGDSVKWIIQGVSGPVYQDEFDYTFDQVGVYEVMLVVFDTDYGCSDTAYFSVTVESNPDVSEPDVFSPNGDGINDLYYFDVEDIGEFHGMIYNRWGQLVFEWYDSNQGWNGVNLSGQEASEGTYFYILKMQDLNQRPVSRSGSFNLIR